MKHDFGQGNRLWSLGWIVFIAAALLAAGCEESTEVTPQPGTTGGPVTGDGTGTSADPFIVNPDSGMFGVDIQIGGRVFFLITPVVASEIYFVEASTDLGQDADLIVHYRDSSYIDEACKPFLFGGTEDCWVVTDGTMSEIYVSVDGTDVLIADTFSMIVKTGFNVSNLLDPGVLDFYIGTAPGGTQLSGTLQSPSEWFWFKAFDEALFSIPFPGNMVSFINECDVNDLWDFVTGPVETCAVQMPPGVAPDFLLRNHEFDVFADAANFTDIYSFTLSLAP